MKKTLLSIIATAGISIFGNSQIEITLAGQSTDISGTVYQLNAYPTYPSIVQVGEIVLDFDITNNTGSSNVWKITRKKLDVPTNWVDKLCIDVCFPVSTHDVFCSPTGHELVLNNGEQGTFQLHYIPDFATAGTGLYRYYIGDCQTFEDSFDIQINYVLGMDELKDENTFLISPNPAQDFVQLNLNNDVAQMVQITDLRGNSIYKEAIIGSTSIDVTTLVDGVYFVTIQTSDSKSSSKKLVIRH